MKALKIVLTAGALCLASGNVTLADHHEKAGMQEGGEAMAEMPPIGPPDEMKEVAILNGDYDVKFWYKVNPMAPDWTETKATAEVSLVAGGAAQQMIFEGEMMGIPFEGIGFTSYDRETSKWQMIWVDSMGARISMYTGDLKDGEMVVEGKDLGQGMTFHSRLTTYNMNEEGFDWKYEMSMDGENYMETAKATYRKR